MSNDTTETTISDLERGIEEYEQKIRALRTAINTILENAGLPPRYTVIASSGSGNSRFVKIQVDTFYGKKQTPAMREYLEMRKLQGLGPATPREIYETLRAGGFQFETKDDTVALIGVRALLRTQPNVFHKLPQGTYGLTLWYPDAKRQRLEAAGTKKAKRGSKRKKRGGGPKTTAAAEPQDRPDLKIVEPTETSKKPRAA